MKRTREYLTAPEMASLIKATSSSRYPSRDRAILQVLYRHGLRASELCNLELGDLDLKTMRLNVRRLKQGLPTVHPLQPDTMRLLKQYLKDRALSPHADSDYLFLSERGPMTRWALTYLFETLGKEAGIPFKIHPHMARHATGYYLANKGTDTRLIQDYMGHRSISSTVRYTQVNAARFKELWR